MPHATAHNAIEFKRIFKRSLSDFWHPMLGFDVVAFDEQVVKSDTQSCAAAVQQTWGVDARRLIESLLGMH